MEFGAPRLLDAVLGPELLLHHRRSFEDHGVCGHRFIGRHLHTQHFSVQIVQTAYSIPVFTFVPARNIIQRFAIFQ